MHPAFNVFMQRFRSDFKQQRKAWNMVLDWTVFVYFLIPGVAIAIFFYMEWLQEIPFIFTFIGWYGWTTLLFLTMFIFEIKLFTYVADQLFLSRNIPFLRKITQYGIIYSFGHTIILGTIIFILPVPLLMELFSLDTQKIILLYICYITVSCLFNAWKKYLKLYISSSIYRIVNQVLPIVAFILGSSFIIDSPTFTFIWMGLSIFGCFVLSRKILYNGNNFLKIALLDDASRNQMGKLLLMDVNNQGYRPPSQTKPRLWKQSQVMFKQQTASMIFTDAFFKSIIRNQRLLFPIFQLSGLLIAFIILTSGRWVTYIVWGISIYIIIDIAKTGWMAFRQDPFIRLFRWDETMLRDSLEKCVLYLATPILIFLNMIFGYLQFQVVGLLLFPLLSILLVNWGTRSFLRNSPVS
ncbi:ABC transporter permease [Oceanobacillus sp. 1P07AA]|uniref:ABC transporter permease n=1 Tax=Oceanobacillus sp. 1P07AA TaxID=3132293 RepID=UPI0039A6A4E7